MKKGPNTTHGKLPPQKDIGDKKRARKRKEHGQKSEKDKEEEDHKIQLKQLLASGSQDLKIKFMGDTNFMSSGIGTELRTIHGNLWHSF